MNKEEMWLLNEKYNGRQTEKFKKDLKRLQAGEPIDYVIGFTEFLGCKIDLSKKPLIPRPETEYWFSEAIKQIKAGAKVLDIFAGSGCIGIVLLKNVPGLLCDIADNDENAITQIKINLKINRLIRTNKPMVKVVRSDVFKNIKGEYDYIFANPPYIPKTKISKVQTSVLKFEPKQALFGGKDGLFYIRKFLEDAKKYLNPGGVIFMEFDSPQKKYIEKIISKNKYSKYEFHRDQYSKWRWVEIG